MPKSAFDPTVPTVPATTNLPSGVTATWPLTNPYCQPPLGPQLVSYVIGPVSAGPLADAVIVTVWVPSRKVSSTDAIGNVADVCPAGMVTDAGTVASLVSLLLRLTTSAWSSGRP